MLPLLQPSLHWLSIVGVGLALALPRSSFPCCSAATASRAERYTAACGCCDAGEPGEPRGDAPATPDGANADPVKCTACAAPCCVKTLTSAQPVVVTPTAGVRALLPPADEPPRSATVRGVFHPPRF